MFTIKPYSWKQVISIITDPNVDEYCTETLLCVRHWNQAYIRQFIDHVSNPSQLTFSRGWSNCETQYAKSSRTLNRAGRNAEK